MSRTDPAVVIRGFQAADREAVRAICCDTADRGRPIERFFSDRSFAGKNQWYFEGSLPFMYNNS